MKHAAGIGASPEEPVTKRDGRLGVLRNWARKLSAIANGMRSRPVVPMAGAGSDVRTGHTSVLPAKRRCRAGTGAITRLSPLLRSHASTRSSAFGARLASAAAISSR